jgi:hypothetical protein
VGDDGYVSDVFPNQKEFLPVIVRYLAPGYYTALITDCHFSPLMSLKRIL